MKHHIGWSGMGISLAFAALAVTAGENHDLPKVDVPKAFGQLKPLIGTWEGTTQMGEKSVPVKTTYEMTSGGTAIIERLFVGTPHEMVSVYHPEGDQVVMTHYCMLGNRPKLTMKKSDNGSLTFQMVGTQGIRSRKEMHMHAVTMTFKDDKTLTQEWIGFDKGKMDHATVVQLAKK